MVEWGGKGKYTRRRCAGKGVKRIKDFTPRKIANCLHKGDLSNNRVRAHVLSLALHALAAAPHLVELLAGGGHDGGFVGEDPQRNLRLRREVQDGGVEGGVGDELEHSNLRNENFT